MAQIFNPAKRVGENLKNLIKQSQYRTQERFAYAIPVDPVTVRRWLAKGVKDIDTIFVIASKLNVDFQELLK